MTEKQTLTPTRFLTVGDLRAAIGDVDPTLTVGDLLTALARYGVTDDLPLGTLLAMIPSLVPKRSR
jgi:hypothetical protein